MPSTNDVVRTTERTEVGITWSGRLHVVAPGTEVKRFPAGDFAPASCNSNISVLLELEPRSAGPQWDMRARQLHNFHTGGPTPRLPQCKHCGWKHQGLPSDTTAAVNPPLVNRGGSHG